MHITLLDLYAIAGLVLIIVILGIRRSPELRGLLSEIKLSLLARCSFRKPDYLSLERMSLFELLDHPTHHEILVSRFGVFCIEYVSYCGHIESRPGENYWYLHQGRKWYRFANPIERSQGRAQLYLSALNLPKEHVHALTVFSGCAQLEEGLHPQVFKGSEFIKHIRGFRKLVLSKSQIQLAITQIARGVNERLPTTSAERAERIARPTRRARPIPVAVASERQDDQAQDVITKESPTAQPIMAAHSCPVCGDKMLLRKITKGGKQGMHLWGCASFPDCRTPQWLK
ncbi:NERD domain-containing protein [Limnobacter sp.]|uniref:nuclease-related domain-containing protein n=1 Tax=Limnobacter sp. TaxID=2003368 RepID=UPI002583EA15|nr:NERD domain-containing protein [Limnobacter sp.]